MKRLILLLALIPLLVIPAYAEPADDSVSSLLGIDNMDATLTEKEKALSGTIGENGSYDTAGALQRLWNYFLESVSGEMHSYILTVAQITGISLFCAVAGAVCDNEKPYSEYINFVACCAVTVIAVSGMDSLASLARDTLARLNDYSKAVMPCLFTACALCGEISSSAAKYCAVCLSIDVIMTAAEKLIIPMIYAYLAFSVSHSVSGVPMLKAGAKVTKWLSVTLMTAITVVFTSYISLTGILAGSTDAVAVKTTKTVISTVLPVVGGIISDASSVVLSAASVIKNAAGIFALAAVCAVCIGPFAALSVRLLLIKAAAAVSETADATALPQLLDSFANAVGMLLGLVGSSCVMLFISFMSAVKAVTAV